MQIYIARGGQHHGPYDPEAVKAGLGTGAFSPADLAWYEGAPNWAPLATLPGLQGANAPAPMPAPVPGPMPTPDPAPPTPALPLAPFPPTTPPVAPVYDPNAAWARGAGRGVGIGGLFKLLPVRIGVGVLGLIIVGFGIRQITGGKSSGGSSASSPAAGATPSEPTTHFVNNRADYTGNRAAHYLDFQFDYPAAWLVKKGAETASSNDFVELNHQISVQGQNVPAEQFSVSSLSTNNNSSIAALLPQFGPQWAAGVERNQRQSAWGQYRKISEGPTKFGSYDAYEYRDEVTTKGTNGEALQIWSRYVVVVPPTGPTAAQLSFATTSRLPEMHGTDDIGTKGGLAIIAKSFRLGK